MEKPFANRNAANLRMGACRIQYITIPYKIRPQAPSLSTIWFMMIAVLCSILQYDFNTLLQLFLFLQSILKASIDLQSWLESVTYLQWAWNSQCFLLRLCHVENIRRMHVCRLTRSIYSATWSPCIKWAPMRSFARKNELHRWPYSQNWSPKSAVKISKRPTLQTVQRPWIGDSSVEHI